MHLREKYVAVLKYLSLASNPSNNIGKTDLASSYLFILFLTTHCPGSFKHMCGQWRYCGENWLWQVSVSNSEGGRYAGTVSG